MGHQEHGNVEKEEVEKQAIANLIQPMFQKSLREKSFGALGIAEE